MSTVNPITGVAANDYTDYAERTGVETHNAGSANTDAFSAILYETLKELNTGLITDAGTTASASPFGMPGSFMPIPSQSQSLEQAIETASSTGNSNDAMVALLMMMVMMQSNQGGDFSILMQVMAAMIGNLQKPNEVRHDFLMKSGGEPYTLDTIDQNVFNTDISAASNMGSHGYGKPIPALSETGEVDLPLQWWRPTTPVIVNTPGQRSPAMLRAVVDQFNVDKAERYRPGREGNTYCNIFVWDVTRAMGAELPFYTDPATGEPRYHPDTKGAKAMGAIAMDKWLQDHGEKYGWQEIDAQAAQMHANMGRPVVTTAGSIGHVQIVVPSKDGSFDPVRGVTIAQAGRQNSNYMYISGSYNAHRLNNHVRYWVHQ